MLLTFSAASTLLAQPQSPLAPLATRDQKVVRRWSLGGDPRGVAIGRGGTLYVGLAQPQSVIAIDPKSGTVLNRLVLDSPDIASTKELLTLRTSGDGSRLLIANGSDESATILSLPDMKIVREITIEGEPIRDALPDPKGRYVYLLGRHVHVFDADGKHELRTIAFDEPMAIAASANGSTLALVGSEDFGNTRATVVALFDTTTFAEITRDPLQTDRRVESALFADDDRALVALSRDYLFEKHLVPRASKTMSSSANGSPMRITIDFGDLVNSDRICLPDGSGPQIAALAPNDLFLFAEKRCSSSSAFSGSARRITPASLYGVSAYAIAYDRDTNTLAATDRAGYLTIYKVPRAAATR